MKYTIKITQTLEGYAEVEAASANEALQKAEELYVKNGHKLPDMEDVNPLSFAVDDLQTLMSRSSANDKFIFDDELCVDSAKCISVDGYLWATDYLVNRIKEQQGEQWSDTAENINFYAVYDVTDNTISVVGTYDALGPDKNDINVPFELYLSPDEKVELHAAMEAYCLEGTGKSCFEFVNSLREWAKLAPLNVSDNTVEIYQLRLDDEEIDMMRFRDMEFFEKRNFAPSADKYELVYSGSKLPEETLEDIYTRFNTRHPVGYRSYSLSISDVVGIKTGETERAYFVDNFGFKPLPEFYNELAKANKPSLDDMVKNADARKPEQSVGKDVQAKDIDR